MKKKLSFFIALSIVMLFFNCSSNSDDSSIYHKWYFKDKIYNGVSHPYTYDSCGKEYIQFYDSNKYRIATITDCQVNLSGYSLFTREGNTITITFQTINEPVLSIFQITELTSNTLTLEYDIDYSGGAGQPTHFIEKFER